MNFLLVGLAAGCLSGLMGMGGNVVIVPALVLLFNFSQHQAQGTTLALMALPVGLLAAIGYYREGLVEAKAVAYMFPGFLIGAFLGSRVALTLPEASLRRVFGAFLLAVAARLIFAK